MKKLLLLGIGIATGLSLSACGSTGTQTVGQEQYIKTIDQRTDKAPTALAQCLELSLKEYQASSYMRSDTVDIWRGAVPSGDSGQPQATIDVEMPSYGRGQIHAHLKVFQREPIVEEINEFIRTCL
ncbi:MAG: hypothetical protein GX860_05985 [Alcaligenaceae bacterium]|nr:hypothetical protein [Alcaligenaceae bacterium]